MESVAVRLIEKEVLFFDNLQELHKQQDLLWDFSHVHIMYFDSIHPSHCLLLYPSQLFIFKFQPFPFYFYETFVFKNYI